MRYVIAASMIIFTVGFEGTGIVEAEELTGIASNLLDQGMSVPDGEVREH